MAVHAQCEIRWDNLPPTSQALQCDYFAHIHCDGDAQTIYRAALAVTVLKHILVKEGDANTGIKTVKKTLLQAVNKCFDTVEDKPLYALAILLDPRYNNR